MMIYCMYCFSGFCGRFFNPWVQLLMCWFCSSFLSLFLLLLVCYVHIIFKPQLLGVFDKYTTRLRGQRKFVTDKPLAEGLGVNQWQTSDDWGQGQCICQLHYSSCGSYDIYYVRIRRHTSTPYSIWYNIL